jgi:phosphoketolase
MVMTAFGIPIEVTFRAHQVPLATVRENPEHLKILEVWMRSNKYGMDNMSFDVHFTTNAENHYFHSVVDLPRFATITSL